MLRPAPYSMTHVEDMTRCRPGLGLALMALAMAMALFLVSFFAAVDAHAKLVLYSFEEKINQSEAIVIGKVVKIRKGLLGKYSASVQTIRVIKGDFKEKEFVIKYGQLFWYPKEDTTELVENESYVLFLTPYKSCYRLVGADDGYYRIRDSRTVCHEQKDFLLEDFIKTIKGIAPRLNK